MNRVDKLVAKRPPVEDLVEQHIIDDGWLVWVAQFSDAIARSSRTVGAFGAGKTGKEVLFKGFALVVGANACAGESKAC